MAETKHVTFFSFGPAAMTLAGALWLVSTMMACNNDITDTDAWDHRSDAGTPTADTADANQMLRDATRDVSRDAAPMDSDSNRPAPARISGPSSLNFGHVTPVNDVKQSLELKNVGESPAFIETIVFQPDPGGTETNPSEFVVDPEYDFLRPSASDQSIKLKPSENIEIPIWFVAVSGSGLERRLVVENRDGESVHTVQLAGNTNRTCVELTSDGPIEFRAVDRGNTPTTEVGVKNCNSYSPVELSVSFQGSEAFTFSNGSRAYQLTLSAGEQKTLQLKFNASAVGRYAGTLRVEPVEGMRPVLTRTTSARVVSDCTVPIIRASGYEAPWETADPTLRLATKPAERIQLSATASYPSRDAENISRYEWTLLDKPSSAPNPLTDHDDSKSFTVSPRTPGTYLIELGVTDDLGHQSCRKARLELDVAPRADVYATLTWQTPGDTDPDDGLGSDLDLHVRNDTGSWNQPPGDCFWANPSPDWGPSGPRGNPEFLQDVVNGQGPERIEIARPQPDAAYTFGVDYFSAFNLGKSHATLRVWVGGQLAHDTQRRNLQPGEFWSASRLEWPSGTFTPIQTVTQGFP